MYCSHKQDDDFYISIKKTGVILRVLADEMGKGVITLNDEGQSIIPDAPVKINLKTKGNKFSAKLSFKLKTSSIDR